MGPKSIKTLLFAVAAILAALLAVLIFQREKISEPDLYSEQEQTQEEPLTLYGFVADEYEICDEVIKSGESLSVILGRYGVTASMVDSLQRVCRDVFDVRTIRAGKNYKAFLSSDTLGSKLSHFVYEKDPVNYVVMSFDNGIEVRAAAKDVYTEKQLADVTINSSLWNAMVEEGVNTNLAIELENVFAWTVDFFGLQKQDKFKIIYDESYVDGEKYGVGKVWGAWFENSNKRYYAIPYGYDSNGKLLYWDENGNSLRKTMLKAPLNYSRISSRFSNSRLHPVLKIRRPHHGVDYAAPAGTEVYAVADGVITQRNYTGGGGNTVKIKHVHGGLETAYLHLSKFAQGIAVGKRVAQGDLIGYVGSTGLSTGPHLDYRVYKNGQAIDPLKITSEPVAPIDPADSAHFARVKDMVILGLEGQLALDRINFSKDSTSLAYAEWSNLSK